MVECVKYTKEYAPLIQDYQLTNDDLRFTMSPREAMESSDPALHHILVLDQGQLVTFFSLDEITRSEPFSDNAQALIIRFFSTDTRYQGLGYGQQVFQVLPAFIEKYFPAATEIVLAVNAQNEAGQALYKKCGFRETMQYAHGRTGAVNIMRKDLQKQKVLA